MKTALITGITGQDGSYLAELLLEKGYRVAGLLRRSSTVPFERIHHLRDRIELVHGDLLDPSSLHRAIETTRPEEVYNLAAQSFVPTSWTEPVLTAEFTAVGVTRLLEAIRQVDAKIRFYQASSSEMFGKVREVPQTETTAFYPRSPYGVAKVYAHWVTVNYRESYGLHASSGILFNHECVTGDTPVVVRRSGVVDIVPIADLVPHAPAPAGGPPKVPRFEREPLEPLEVWDREGFARVHVASARWSEPGERDAKTVVLVEAPGAVYRASADHVSMCEGGRERPTGELAAGDRLALARTPPAPSFAMLTDDEAWLLGVLTAAGEPRGDELRVAASDRELQGAVERAWRRTTLGHAAASGAALRLAGAPERERSLAAEVFVAGERRVPRRILNADPSARLAFLRGYRDGERGARGSRSDAIESLGADSACVAAALAWLAGVTLGPRRIAVEGDRYRVVLEEGGPPEQIVRVSREEWRGWLFDLATDSGTFHAGIGDAWLHNSPRRGLEFVTRKVTDAAARISVGAAREVRLGNLEAKRDWGYAGDYVEAMWLMLQQQQPDDFVIATGETHSVQELCEIAFARVGLDWRKHVVVDPKFLRPAEVDLLIGNAAKARRVLGWKPTTSFRELIERMVDVDVERAKRAPAGG